MRGLRRPTAGWRLEVLELAASASAPGIRAMAQGRSIGFCDAFSIWTTSSMVRGGGAPAAGAQDPLGAAPGPAGVHPSAAQRHTTGATEPRPIH